MAFRFQVQSKQNGSILQQWEERSSAESMQRKRETDTQVHRQIARLVLSVGVSEEAGKGEPEEFLILHVRLHQKMPPYKVVVEADGQGLELEVDIGSLSP